MAAGKPSSSAPILKVIHSPGRLLLDLIYIMLLLAMVVIKMRFLPSSPGRCLRHGFSAHFRFELTSPYPFFLPTISLKVCFLFCQSSSLSLSWSTLPLLLFPLLFAPSPLPPPYTFVSVPSLRASDQRRCRIQHRRRFGRPLLRRDRRPRGSRLQFGQR